MTSWSDKGGNNMTKPYVNCKKKTCPKVCYPKRDYLRALRKEGRG